MKRLALAAVRGAWIESWPAVAALWAVLVIGARWLA